MGSKTILLVDDDKSLTRLYQEFLPREGFNVLCERDGEWALNTFNQRPIDVVLLDVLVPVLNGFQVAERIRGTDKGRLIPIIFMSGVYKAQNHRDAVRQKYGALEFLEKPFEPAKLIALLKDALGSDYPRPEDREKEAHEVEKKAATLADESTRSEAAEVEHEAKTGFRATASRGNFRQKPFAEILAELYRWRATGALLMRHAAVKKIVYFNDGRPSFVKSNLLSECLGKVMVRERMITEPECEDSLRKMKESGRQQGTILIEMGCISPHNLKYALQLQLETKLFDVFSWIEGDWQFNPKADVPQAITTLDTTPATLIYEGIRRGYDEQRVRDAMGAVDDYHVVQASDPLLRFQDIGMDPEETQLWESIDGKKTVRQHVDAGVMSPDEALRFLYAMKCAQMIELTPPPAKPKPEDGRDEEDEPTRRGPTPLLAAKKVGAVPEEEDEDATPLEASPPVGDVVVARPTPLASLLEVPAPAPITPAPMPPPPVPAQPAHGSRPPEAGSSGSISQPAHEAADEPTPPPIPLTMPVPALAALLEVPVLSKVEGPPLPLTHVAPSPAPAPIRLTVPAPALASLLEVPHTAPAPFASLLSPPLPPHAAAHPAPPPLPPPARSDEHAMRDKLIGKLRELKGRSYYDVLGADVHATSEQIKRAYFSLSKEYHPDKLSPSAGGELRRHVGELYDLFTEAYDVLSDPEAREKYRQTLPEAEREKQGPDPMAAILAAEGKFQKGQELMLDKQYKAAHESFKEAARLYSEEGEFHAWLGWSLYQTDPHSQPVVQQSLDHIERAIALNPKVDKAYLFLGYIYQETGRKDKAEKQFEKAIRVNPDCREALVELKALARA